MECKQWSYEEYPEFEYDGADGVIETTGDEIGVRYLANVVYATMDGIDLHLQILYPKTRNHPTGSYPCIVHVQGSAWMKQNLYSVLPLLTRYSEQGFVVALVEYRHSGIASFPTCAIDARNAIRFLKQNHEQYNVDPTRMILSGDSSGGHTSMFGGIINDDDEPTNLFPGISASVNGIINMYGSTSFLADDSNPSTTNHCAADSPEGKEMGNRDMNENPILKQQLSVECNIDDTTKLPPVFIIHGTKDRIVNPSCSVAVYEQLKKTNHEAYLYLLKGADHGGSEFYSQPVMKVVLEFINHCLNAN